MSTIPIAPNVFSTDPELRLIGGRHRHSRKFVFPLPAAGDFDAVELPARGVLWSFTVQRFAPKSPPFRRTDPFVPFAVGYVELPGALIVETPLTQVAFEDLHVGLAMELTTIDCGRDAGDIVQTFAFRPSASAGGAA